MSVKYTTSKTEKIKIYHLEGELIDKDSHANMLIEMDTDIAAGINTILVDLSKLKYINSNGLTIILTILRKAKAAGGSISVCCANDKVTELLKITKLNTLFKVYKKMDEAIASLSE